MVSYQVPKAPQTLFQRVRDSARLAVAYAKGDRTTIADITSETYFSPLQPMQPYTPNIVGRTWDYAPGYNIQFRPDGYGRVSFSELRRIARDCEILGLVLQTVKDQICGFKWQIVPKEDAKVKPDDPRIKEITSFLAFPDKIHTFDQWLRLMLDDFLVIDALSIYRVKDRVGRPYAFEVIDGATIKVLIDGDGRRPLPPDPAYQQIIKGAPRVDYDMTELLYMPRNLMTYYPVRGYSAVEQIVTTARTSIERAKSQLAFFTEGTLPDSYAEMPVGMTTDSIRAFEDRFNDLLRGNTAMRRGTPFLPSGSKIVPLKQTELKNEADEWFTRIICFCLGIPPTAFVKQMNRSTSETDKERAQEEGQLPKMQYIKLVMDQLIGDFGPEYSDNFEFTWREGTNQDPKEQADVIAEYVKAGVKSINEGRSELGLDPIEGGDVPMALTPTGYVPLDSFAQNQAMQQQNMQAQADAKANAAEQSKEKPEPVAGKSLGKEVSRQAHPFQQHIIDHAEQELTLRIWSILQKTARSVAGQLRQEHLKLAKDDDDDAAEIALVVGSLDLSSLEALIDATPAYLQRIAGESGKQTLAMLGVFNRSDLVNQVNQDSLAYAKARSAEMVGKKWVDDELVDNPNADWVITDATRDELRGILSDVYSGDLAPDHLETAITNAGAFSEDRAALIARTELIRANGEGTLAGMRSAKSIGVAVKKQWIPDADACFPAGTAVATQVGEINIEQIAVGDCVLTRNGPRKVMAVSKRPYKGTFVRIASRNGHVVKATPNHPIFVNGDWVGASDIAAGDLIQTRQNEFVEVLSVTNVNLIETECAPALSGDPLVSLGISALVVMPNLAINLDVNGVGGEGEVTDISTECIFLFERYVQVFKNYTNGLLNWGFTVRRSITSEAAKLAVLFRFGPAEAFTAALTLCKRRWIGASHRTEFADPPGRACFPFWAEPLAASVTGNSFIDGENGIVAASARTVFPLVVGRSGEGLSAVPTGSLMDDTSDGVVTRLRAERTGGFAALMAKKRGATVGAVVGERQHRKNHKEEAGTSVVYNLMVEGIPEYYANGILVHNCQICLDNGDAGAIDVDDIFPSGDDTPGAHPNCECSIVPVTSDGDEEE